MGLTSPPAITLASTNVFNRTLLLGMKGEDVRKLQKFLNVNLETRIAGLGMGSPGNETDYFGLGTMRALIKFQEKYRAEILTPFGLIQGTGIWGVKTRDKANNMLGVMLPAASVAQNIGRPARLRIPAINVDAVTEYVGLTDGGDVDAPKGPVNAAWYGLGPLPGKKGTSVIVGHFGWKDGIRAVFDDLNKLKKGDKIYVEDEKGATVVFVVRELRVYGEGEESSGVFISNDDGSHLNLITCGGVWSKTDKSYSNRLVVFTDKE